MVLDPTIISRVLLGAEQMFSLTMLSYGPIGFAGWAWIVYKDFPEMVV